MNLSNATELYINNKDVNEVRLNNNLVWSKYFQPDTNGLVMFIDGANPSSYPGSGNTWYDISGNNHNISLGSTVSYTSSFGGVLTFPENGNGYGRNTTMNLSTSNYTVITYVRKLSNYQNNWLIGHHDDTYGDYYAEGWVNNISSPKSDTTWRMFAGTGHISNDVYQLYINDSLIVQNNLGSQGPRGWNFNNQYSQYSNCQIANLIVYNRVLSASEIQDVYNKTKGRFGL
jgi:hypothetical protein